MLHTPLAKIALAPVLIPQALHVRRVALVMPEAEGPRQGTAGAGRPVSVLVCGDSSAAGVGAKTQDQALSGRIVADLARDHAVDWRLEAASGRTTAQTLAHLRDLAPLGRDHAVVALGVNDITRQVPLARWLDQVRALVEVLVDRHGARRVYWSGFPPVERFSLLPQPLRAVLAATARRHDAALADLAADHPVLSRVGMDLDPARSQMAPDGFHPGPSVYAQWGALMAARIRAEAARHG